MLDEVSLGSLLFIDIETATLYPNLEVADENTQILWQKKIGSWDESLTPQEWYIKKGALYAEFAKVISIAVGFFYTGENQLKIRVKKISGEESDILKSLNTILSKSFSNIEKYRLCGHNIKNFDIPFLCRRMVANQLKVPPLLDANAHNPWDMPVVDTLQIWKFGEYKNYTSLNLIAHTLGVELPKKVDTNINIHGLYWEDKNIDAINKIAVNDVVATAQIILKLKLQKLIEHDNISIDN